MHEKEYNTLITIYIIGPVYLLFLLRVNRTLRENKISQHTRRMVLIVLFAQYNTMVVVRYDTIRGAVHYICTFLTFLKLLLHHGIVSNTLKHESIDFLKPILAFCSVVFMFGFGGLVVFPHDIKNNTVLWTVCCFLEIAALFSLGALDILDIYRVGIQIDS